jgi:hypothetical protein
VRSSPGVLGEAFIWAEGGGGERPGEAEKQLEMVGSFNGFNRFSIEGGSGEDWAGHHFEKRRAGGAVDSACLGAKELVGGIGAAAMPTEGGGGYNCSGMKKVKAVGEQAGIGPKAEWAGHAGPKRKLGQRRIKSRKMKIKWVGCKELWAKNDFELPRENENIFEIFWLQI